MNYAERLREERADLVGRLNKLTSFLHTEEFKAMRKQDQALLVIQHSTMMTLSIIMFQRIERAKNKGDLN